MVKWILSLSLLAALGVGCWFYFRPNETAQVKARVFKLAEEVSKSGDEAPLAALGKAQAVANAFADSCDVKIEGEGVEVSGTFRREDLPSRAVIARAHFRKVRFSVYDLSVSLRTRLVAFASFTVMAVGELPSGESFREARDVEILLVKADGSWRISSLKVENPVKR